MILALAATLAGGCVAGGDVGVASEALTTFTVTVTTDDVDANPGDGLCRTPRGECTLRAALMEANATGGLDEIVMGTGTFNLTLTGAGEDDSASGDLDINESVTIRGEGPQRTRIIASNEDRVFHVVRGEQVTLVDLRIEGGNVEDDGGGLLNDGESLTHLERVAVIDNEAKYSGGIGNLTPYGRLTLVDVEVRGNHARSSNGGVGNAGTLDMDRVTIAGNTADDGVGGFFGGGLVHVLNSTISGNTGASPVGWAGSLTGGAFIGGVVTMENVTISGNTGDPGAVWVGGRLDMVHVTIEDNTGGLMNCDACGGRTTSVNSIISNSEFVPGVNCYGTITSGGYNIDSGDSCGFGASGDMIWTDPRLLPLGNAMGVTEVHALDRRSPAIDAARLGSCPGADQRGVRRPQGRGCDIGAVEYQESTHCIDTTADEEDDRPGDGICRTASGACSLRAAILETNATPGPEVITFCKDGLFALTLRGAREDGSLTGDLDITDSVTIRGNGRTLTYIDGGRADRVFDIGPGAARVSVVLSDLTVQRGTVDPGFGGGMQVGSASNVLATGITFESNAAIGAIGAGGGGISNDGELELRNAYFGKNRARGSLSLGGAITTSGVLRVFDSTFYANASDQHGGGIFVGAPAGDAELVRTRLEGNYAAAWGGGIASHGRLVAIDSTLFANRAFSGGGLWTHPSGITEFDRVTVSSNSASYAINGSGLHTGGPLTLSNSTISGNTGTNQALAVGAATLTNVTIADNDGGIWGASARLVNTIVGAPRTGSGCTVPIVSLGHNIDFGNSCRLGATDDQPNTDPFLGRLRNNGGPTETHALDPNSRAIDAGDASMCSMTDQRGLFRVGICDIGAYEAQ